MGSRPNRPLRIGLDARSIFMPRPRGTGRNLADAYRRLPGLRPHWQFTLYHQRSAATDLARPNVRTRRIDILGDRHNLWLNLRLPLAAWRDGIDLLHLPANEAPPWCPVPYVATVHDLIPLRVDDECAARQRATFRRRVARACRGAVHLIVPSNATRDEVHDEFGVPLERISVIPWAADHAIAATAGDAAARRRAIELVRGEHRLRDPWLLNFSGPSRRKNAHAIVEALALLPPHKRGKAQVVLVGCEPASFREALLARATQLGIRPHVRPLGFVPHEHLPGLLAGARGLLIPSLMEGFGLPILDAWACDVPVLASNTSSMPEVAADAAEYCDPRSPTSIARGIGRLLDDGIAADLRTRGAARLTQFSWHRTARLMGNVYAHALDTLGHAAPARVSATPRLLPAIAVADTDAEREGKP